MYKLKELVKIGYEYTGTKNYTHTYSKDCFRICIDTDVDFDCKNPLIGFYVADEERPISIRNEISVKELQASLKTYKSHLKEDLKLRKKLKKLSRRYGRL